MAKSAMTRRIRTWTGRSGRAISYGPFARLSDWWCAGRDAKKRLPDLVTERPAPPDTAPSGSPADGASDPSTTWLATPRMVVLSELGRGRMEAEWIKYKAEVHDELIGLTRARAQREALDAELALAEEELEHAPPEPSEGDLRRRVGGERYTDVAVVRARRLADHTRLRTETKKQALDIARRIRDQDVQIAGLGEPIRVRFEVAQTRAAMIDAYVRRRCAAYLTRLIRKHPQGSHIRQILPATRPALPAWTVGARSPDLDDLPTSLRTRQTPPFARAIGPNEPSMKPEDV
jgi:hypothetical protein